MYGLNKFFEDFETTFIGSFPVHYTMEDNTIKVSLPGVSKEEVSMTAKRVEEDKTLVELKVKKDSSPFINKEVIGFYIYRDIDINTMKSSMDKGILTIEYDLNEESKPKTITID